MVCFRSVRTTARGPLKLLRKIYRAAQVNRAMDIRFEMGQNFDTRTTAS